MVYAYIAVKVHSQSQWIERTEYVHITRFSENANQVRSKTKVYRYLQPRPVSNGCDFDADCVKLNANTIRKRHQMFRYRDENFYVIETSSR